MWDPLAELRSTVLPNGLTVYTGHWEGRPWEAVGFVIHSGAEHDPVGLEGLAHFVEHLVSANAGTPQQEIESFFEDHGGTVNFGGTGYPATSYGFFVPGDHLVLSRALSFFGSMLLSAELTEHVERERKIIIGEFHRRYPTNINLHLDSRMRAMLYRGHWLERFVRPLGSPESIDRITQADLQRYYDAHYTPANMSIVALGGMKHEDVLECIAQSTCAVMKPGSRTPVPPAWSEVSAPLEPRYVFEASRYYSTPVSVGGYRSIARVPKVTSTLLSVVRAMLDRVLFAEVRERHSWAYAIQSSHCDYRSFHEFSIHCNGLALEALDRVEGVVNDCISSLLDRCDLFEEERSRALARNRMADYAGRSACDEAVGDLVVHQRIVPTAEVIRRLESVTFEEVTGVVKQLRPEQRWTLITRP